MRRTQSPAPHLEIGPLPSRPVVAGRSTNTRRCRRQHHNADPRRSPAGTHRRRMNMWRYTDRRPAPADVATATRGLVRRQRRVVRVEELGRADSQRPPFRMRSGQCRRLELGGTQCSIVILKCSPRLLETRECRPAKECYPDRNDLVERDGPESTGVRTRFQVVAEHPTVPRRYRVALDQVALESDNSLDVKCSRGTFAGDAPNHNFSSSRAHSP